MELFPDQMINRRACNGRARLVWHSAALISPMKISSLSLVRLKALRPVVLEKINGRPANNY